MLTTTTILKIYGMTCASCAVRLEKVLHRVDGVTGASVNLASEEAWVEGGTLAAVTQAVADAGFTAVPALLDGDDDGARLDPLEQCLGGGHVMVVSRRNQQPDRPAFRIDACVDFRREAAAASTDTTNSTLFLTPEACW